MAYSVSVLDPRFRINFVKPSAADFDTAGSMERAVVDVMSGSVH